MYQKDPNYISLIWGRKGAAILLLVSLGLSGLGFTFGEEDQATAHEAISAILAGVALCQVLFSKIRESQKIKEAKTEENSND